jgi:predicted MFS family arabinose efflux permease
LNTNKNLLTRKNAAIVFFVFATAYFISTLIRAITATLSPTLSLEFQLEARDLGLLAGGYFLGFSIMQLLNGFWLDKYGPKKVILYLLCIAVVSCLVFSISTNFISLLLSRIFIGIGVSACLMAPLTGYRRWFAPNMQQRANAWMLMTGALGMLASTLPVQLLLPVIGWRYVFIILALLFVISFAIIVIFSPSWSNNEEITNSKIGFFSSYLEIWKNPYFKSLVPLGFFNYGGLMAIQTLWAGPWMTNVSGYSALQSATGLFWLNFSMLITFWLWGLINPYILKKGISADKIIVLGMPSSLVVLLITVYSGSNAGALHWTLFCVCSVFISLTHPAIGLAFSNNIAGRALSSFNLVIFFGVFVVQWGIGIIVDVIKSFGHNEILAFQGAFLIFFICCTVSYIYFLIHRSDHLRN